jgi:hypothetical protein
MMNSHQTREDLVGISINQSFFLEQLDLEPTGLGLGFCSAGRNRK